MPGQIIIGGRPISDLEPCFIIAEAGTAHGGELGAAIELIDAAVDAGLAIAQLSDATVRNLARLSAKLDRNPVDLGPTMVLTDQPMPVYEKTVEIVLDDPNVDCATLILYAGTIGADEDTISMVDRLSHRISKPTTIWLYGTKMDKREKMARLVEEMGLPTYTDLETAIKALGIAVTYARYRASLGSSR